MVWNKFFNAFFLFKFKIHWIFCDLLFKIFQKSYSWLYLTINSFLLNFYAIKNKQNITWFVWTLFEDYSTRIWGSNLCWLWRIHFCILYKEVTLNNCSAVIDLCILTNNNTKQTTLTICKEKITAIFEPFLSHSELKKKLNYKYNKIQTNKSYHKLASNNFLKIFLVFLAYQIFPLSNE